jgi:hypothetical protein
MRTKRDINLIYKHTHNDFKSNSNNVKKVMFLSELGCTTLGSIENLPDNVFNEKLAYAVKKEEKQKIQKNCKNIEEEIFVKKYGKIVGHDYVSDRQYKIEVLDNESFYFHRPQKTYKININDKKIVEVVCY